MASSSTPVSTDTDRPPYRAAAAVFAVVLAGYVYTLAPTVTFWDAGEFIATAKILGIPHPPGTPLFVLMGNVWGQLVPIGDYAYRLNLMSAVFSAAGAAFFFLLVVQALKGWGGGREPGLVSDRFYTMGGAVSAALLSAFVFTVWQNSNETEVYMVATLSIAAVSWLAWVWRRHRGTGRAPHILLFIIYIGAVSIGNHLLALLAGPAVIAFMWHVLRTEPLQNERERRIEWAQWAVLTGIWALLIGSGLGSTGLFVIGGVAFLGAAAFAFRSAGSVLFPLTALVIGAVGVSTYLFLYIRAGLGPFINEADPSTWESLLAVIRREQYPPRSPFDNPVFPSGPENPGRSIEIILLQIQNYLQYFDWQWAMGLAPTTAVFAPVRLPFTLLFTALGLMGARELYERDRSVFWLLLVLFLTTGPVLMGYMNFKPGFSLGWDRFPDPNHHEVRERDYFFLVSFLVWGLFAGSGLATLLRRGRETFRGQVLGRAAPAVLLLTLVPIGLNFRAASRAHGPEATLARDFAYNLLQTVEPYGILFTNGDNDTFPLWYLQEVEEIRQDVSVVNLSLGNTDWYLRQLRDNPVRPFVPEQAPWFADKAPAEPPPPLHRWTEAEIDGLVPQLLPREFTFRAGRIEHTFPANTPFYVKDVLILRLLQENLHHRPIYFSITAGSSNWNAFRRYATNEAMAVRLHPVEPPDQERLVPASFVGVPLDLPRTDSLVWHVYRYARLFEVDSLALDPTNVNIAVNLSLPFLSLGQAYDMRGDRERALLNLRRGYHLAPNPELREVLEIMEMPEMFLPFEEREP